MIQPKSVARCATIAIALSLALIGCGGGSANSTVNPPPTPTGPVSGTEFIYSFGFGSEVQVATLNPSTGAVSSITNATPNLFPLIENGSATSFGKFVYVLGFDQYNASTAMWLFQITGTKGELSLVLESLMMADLLVMDAPNHLFYGFHSSLGSQGETRYTINAYSIDANSGQYQIKAMTTEVLPAGTFDSAAIDPAGRFLYTLAQTPAGVEVFVYSINASTGALTGVPGSPFLVVPVTSDGAVSFLQMLVSPSGNSLNLFFQGRLNGTTQSVSFINVLSVKPTGLLSSISGSPFPLNDAVSGSPTTLSPDGKSLYVPTCGSTPNLGCTGGISVHSVDPMSGVLGTSSTSSASSVLGASNLIDPSGGIFLSINGIPAAQNFKIDHASGALIPVPGSPFPLVNPSAPTWTGYQGSAIVKIP